jgi:PadR family transcriptional regulator, regulatory protein PadR
MSTRSAPAERDTLLQGTLDLLILRILLGGREHGQGIARAIQRTSGDALLVDHGSLYPALQRLEARDWISAEWGTSENNRRARYYSLTALGRKQLKAEAGRWRRLVQAVSLVLGPELAED